MVKDLQHLSRDAFWTYLDHFSWMHVYDARGRKCSSDEMPARFEDMKDDPFRSFSGDVRDAGGYSKPAEPFQEFLWANFFRAEFSSKAIGLDRAIDKAVKLARNRQGDASAGVERSQVRVFPSLCTCRGFEQWTYSRIYSPAART